jgi:transcriptional regulator with XRE-family HTH domain
MRFRFKIDQLRRQNGVTFTAIAEATGLARSTLHRLASRPVSQIDIKVVYPLMQYFDLKSVNQLIDIVPVPSDQPDEREPKTRKSTPQPKRQPVAA